MTYIKDKKMEEVKHLEEENLELKLNDIRKDITNLDKSLTERLNSSDSVLNKILVHVEKTNGSVARVTEAHNILEREYKNHCIIGEEQLQKLSKIDDETKAVRWFLKHPRLWWTVTFILIVIFTNNEITTAILNLISKWI